MAKGSENLTSDDGNTKILVERVVKDLENIQIDATNVFSVIAAQTTILSLSAYAQSMAHQLPPGVKDQLLSKITQATKTAQDSVEQAQKEVEQKQEEIREEQARADYNTTYVAPYDALLDLDDGTATFSSTDQETEEEQTQSSSIFDSSFFNAWHSSTQPETKTTILDEVFADTPETTRAYLANEHRINATHAALTDTDAAYPVDHFAIDALRDIETNAQVMQQCDMIIENCTALVNNPEKCAELGITVDDVEKTLTESKNTRTIAQTATNKEIMQTELKSLADISPDVADRPDVDMASTGLAILQKLREQKAQKVKDTSPSTPAVDKKEEATVTTPETLEYVAQQPVIKSAPAKELEPVTGELTAEKSVQMPYGPVLSTDVAMLSKVLHKSNPFNLSETSPVEQTKKTQDASISFIPADVTDANISSPIAPNDTPGNEEKGIQGILSKKEAESEAKVTDASNVPNLQPLEKKETWIEKAEHSKDDGNLSL